MCSVRLDGRCKRTIEAQAVTRRGCRSERRQQNAASKGKFEDAQIVDSNPTTGDINLDYDFYFPLIAHAILRTSETFPLAQSSMFCTATGAGFQAGAANRTAVR